VVLAFGFLRIAQRSARAVEWFRVCERDFDQGLDKLKKIAIRGFPIKVICLIANGITTAAFHPMVIVVQNLLERPPVNDGLVTLKTFTLFTFKCLDRDRAKLNALDSPPGLSTAF